MGVLGGKAVSYERGTPVEDPRETEPISVCIPSLAPRPIIPSVHTPLARGGRHHLTTLGASRPTGVPR